MHMQPRNDREIASYNAAIKAVSDGMYSDETVAALKGLWRVFDAGVGELGAELNDSLSNKAIFEGEYKKMCALISLLVCANLPHSLQIAYSSFLYQPASIKKPPKGRANPFLSQRKMPMPPTDVKSTNPTSAPHCCVYAVPLPMFS